MEDELASREIENLGNKDIEMHQRSPLASKRKDPSDDDAFSQLFVFPRYWSLG